MADCGTAENTGQVATTGACCYRATVDNVNLVTNELTITFTDIPPGLAAQVVIPQAQISYNCGSCHTRPLVSAGPPEVYGTPLATDNPLFGFELNDAILCLVPRKAEYVLSDVTVIGHEFVSGVEDQKACGQLEFMPLFPSPNYGAPFLVETVVDGVTVCVPVSPHLNPFTGVTSAIGTAGSSPNNLLYYSGGGVLRPYLLPNGGIFDGYSGLNYMIDDSHFDEGTRVVLRTAIVFAGLYYVPVVYWGGQWSRSLGVIPSLGVGLSLTTGTEFTSAYSDKLFRSPVCLVDNGSINVPLSKTNVLRTFAQQWNSTSKETSYDGTYADELLAPVCSPVADYEYVYETIPVSGGTVVYRETLARSSLVNVDLVPWRTGANGVSISLVGATTETGECEHVGNTVVNQVNYYVSGRRELSEVRTYSLNGTELGVAGFSMTMDYGQVGDGADAAWRAPEDPPNCSGALPAAPGGAWGTITWTGSGTINAKHLIFLMCDPLRDFAIFIRTESSTDWNGSSTPNYRSAAWWSFPTGVYTASNSDVKTVNAELCVYSKGIVQVIETYSDSSEADTTGSGNGEFEFEYFATLTGTYSISSDSCTYSGGEVYSSSTIGGTFSGVNAIGLLNLLGGWSDGTYNIPLMDGYATTHDGKIRFIECRLANITATSPFREYSCSDDGALIWIVMRKLIGGATYHRILIEDGAITLNGESKLDQATGLTWDATTMKYAPV